MAGPSSSDSSTSLATACPSCSTVFRVVQDQLKVSQGWVRCGRCHEVFNALEALFDLDVRREGDPPAPRGGAGLTPPASLNPPAPPPPPVAAPAAAAPSSAMLPPAPFPAPVHGGWDESSPAALPDTRKGALSAAAALRDRLAARTGAVAPPPAGRPRGGGLFVEEPVVDEAELDTRFEPKFFDAESAPGSRRPPVSGAPAAETAQPVPPAAPAAPAALTAPAVVAPAPGDADQRREPWLDVDTPEQRPAPAPRPGKDRKSVARPSSRRSATDDQGAGTAGAGVGAGAGAGAAGPAPDGVWTQPWNETIVDPSVMPAQAPSMPMAPLPAGRMASASVAPVESFVDLPTHEPALDVGSPAGRAHLASADDPFQLDHDAINADHPGPTGAGDTQLLAPGGPMTQPGFLREAERKERWQRPWVRAVLGVACLLLVATAALQLGLRNRDRYAARWPVVRPVLAEICGWLDCTLQPPRMLDALVVETSSLTRPPGIDGLRLQLVLRNRVEHEVAAPHVELTLTDAAGAIAARRVFNPGEFGVTRAVLNGQQDSNWSLVFSTPMRNIAGYTVAVFYP